MNKTAQEAVQAMRELNYPEHVIQGFLMNYQDESGFRADVVEAEPNVHGTRGKGIYQLTGDRRKKFEEMYGDDWSVRNQIMFQDWELRNTEKSARDAIFSTDNAGEAGAAIVNTFLRPAEEHRASREASYLGRPPPVVDGVPPVEVKQNDQSLGEQVAGMVPEITGNESIDGAIGGIVADGVDTGVELAAQSAVSALFGSGGDAPPIPQPSTVAPPPMRPIQASGPVMFKIKRSKDKERR